MRNTALIITTLLILSCGKTKVTDSPVIAKVGKTVLTNSDVERLQFAMPNNNYTASDIVTDWVDRELLFLAAKEAGIESDETLKSKVNVYQKDLYGRTFLDNYISSSIHVENSEIRNYYDNNRAMFKRENESVKIMHFFTKIDSVADFIAITLKNPNDSTDRKSLLSEHKVEVITVEKGMLVDVLDNALFSNVRSSNIIGPIKTDYGYHIIEVLNRYKKGTKIDIDEVYDEIYQIIYNQKKQLAEAAFIDSLRNNYNVKIYLEKYR